MDPLRYVMHYVPLQKQSDMGYLTCLLGHIASALAQGDGPRAQLLSLLGIMSVEQRQIDEKWQLAWRITSLEDPAWHLYRNPEKSKESSRNRPTARGIDPDWMSAVLSDYRDTEAVLRMRAPN